MAAVHRSGRWQQQPRTPVKIDPSHWLVEDFDLRFFVAFFWGAPVEMMSNTFGTKNGSAGIQDIGVKQNVSRVAKLDSASSDYYEFAHRPELELLGELTLAWRGRINSGSNYRHFAGKHTGGGSANTPFDFRTDNSAAPKASLVRAAGTARAFDSVSTIPLSVVATVEVSQGTDIGASPSFYIQGANAGSTAPTFSGTATGASAPLRIGRRPDGVVQMDGSTEYVMGCARAMSAEALQEFRDEPYGIFIPMRRRLYSVGGGGGVTASASITDTADTISAAGTVDVAAAAAIADATDTTSAGGAVSVSSVVSVTDATDSITSAGTVGFSGVTADAAIIDTDDAIGSAGAVSIAGAASITDAPDAIGAVAVAALAAAFSVTDSNDSISAAGTTSGLVGGLTAAEIAAAVWAEPLSGPTTAGQILSGMADFLRSRGFLH